MVLVQLFIIRIVQSIYAALTVTHSLFAAVHLSPGKTTVGGEKKHQTKTSIRTLADAGGHQILSVPFLLATDGCILLEPILKW